MAQVKDTLITLAGWLGFRVKFEVDDGEPVFNFQLPMPKWILSQKHLCEELEIFEDEGMLLEADEAEEIVLGCACPVLPSLDTSILLHATPRLPGFRHRCTRARSLSCSLILSRAHLVFNHYDRCRRGNRGVLWGGVPI